MRGFVRYEHDKRKDIYKFTCWLGHRFTNVLHNIGYSKSKHKYLFIDMTMSGFSIHGFFIHDLRHILRYILDTGSEFDVNFKAISRIIDIIDNEIQIVDGKRISLDMDLIKRDMIYAPLPVQKPVYENYINIRQHNMSRGMLLDGPVGVGKTYMALSVSVAIKSEVTLIIAPLATIQKVWVESLSGDDTLFRTKQQYHLVGTDKKYLGEKYVLCHYENIYKIIDLYKKYNINFSMLIVDEVHNFNDMKSKRTQLLINISDTIPFRDTFPMSGTPIKAGYKDLVPILKMVYSNFDNTVMNRFLKLYRGSSWLMREILIEKYKTVTTVLKKTNMRIPPLTTTNVKIKITNGDRYTINSIRKRLKEFVEVRQKELDDNYDVYADIYISLYNKAKTILLDNGTIKESDTKRYEYIVKIIVGAYKKNALMSIPDEIKEANLFEKTYIIPTLKGDDAKSFKSNKSIYKYSSLKVRGEALAHIVMGSRIDCYSEIAITADILEFVNSTTKKTLIFSNYIDVCDAVKASCISKKLTPITVYGDTAMYLNRNVNIFTNIDKANPLIATYKSLSTGVPLIAANVVVLFGLPYRQHVFEQTIGRAWRTGQDKPVSVYIAELDTGEIPNITDRDFDIIDFFRREVASITGKDDNIIMDRGIISDFGPELMDTLSPIDTLISKSSKLTKDIIDRWK